MYRHLKTIKKIVIFELLVLTLLLVLYLTSLPFLSEIKNYFWIIKEYVIAISILAICRILLESVNRGISGDNPLHTFTSLIYTYKMQNFLLGMKQEQIDDTTKNKINRAISKSFINVYKKEVVFKIKLPNLLAAQETIMLNQEIIRQELSMLTNATFSGFERKGKILTLRGRYS
ncbi:hypothetical protein P7H59_07425 [Enterococcus viikkiensis]|uniref:SMODS-associating 2TM beta-strand rich effector domain-containing protein n=1 Tax=Enterococcus viikkiensis TaxID=930854 RepID=A0ABU3FQM6_9ENTE|nr:hypothetical protein [Enterococcus viikkiensis]MDT2828290.1 hypothetical protein [Enterococcus viikkiensis]